MGGLEEKDPVDEESIVKKVKECRRKAKSAQGEWRSESRGSYDMVAGKQWDEEDEAALIADGRVPTVFNRLGTIIDAVSGSEVNNRQEVRYIPREIGDVAENEVLTSAAQWIRDNCDAEDEESDAFVDVLICGVGVTETRMDYEEDDEGKCIVERVDPLEVRWDPAARKRNVADAKWIQRERGFTKDELRAKWPETSADLKSTPELDEDDEGELHTVKEPDGYAGDGTTEKPGGLYAVVQHQWYELECVYKVLSPDTGQIVEVPEERYKAIEVIAQAQGLPMQSAKIHRRRYMQAFVCGSTLLEMGPCPCDDDFSLQVITGRRDRNAGTWYGLVRPMTDPQKWANKFFSQLLHIINTNAKGGLLVEAGAVANKRKFEKDWAKADSVIDLNAGGLGKIQAKQPPVIPPAISELMNFSISSIRDTSGVSLELLGMADRQQAGYLEAQRTRAGLTILAPFFDALRLYRKRQGRVLARFIVQYMNDGRLIKVVGKDREQFVPLLFEPGAMKFDVIVDSAPTSRDMKERTWAALVEILPMLQQQGIPLPPEIIEYAPLPSGLVAAWKPKLQAQQQRAEQGDPMQRAMQQAKVEKEFAAADKDQSQAQLNNVKAQVEALSAMMGQMQAWLAMQFPNPGPGMGPAAQQQPPQGGFFPPQNGPTPNQ